MRTPTSPTEASSPLAVNAPSKNDRIHDLLGAFEAAVGALTKPRESRSRASVRAAGPNPVTPKTPIPATTEAEDKGLLAEAPVRHRTT